MFVCMYMYDLFDNYCIKMYMLYFVTKTFYYD